MNRPIFPIINGMPQNMQFGMMAPVIPSIMQSRINYNIASYAGNMPITPLATSSNIMNLLNTSNLPTSGEYKKIYVGKIPPGVSDTFMLKLLETCGPIVDGRRDTDHSGNREALD
jgi:hypothetical protein